MAAANPYETIIERGSTATASLDSMAATASKASVAATAGSVAATASRGSMAATASQGGAAAMSSKGAMVDTFLEGAAADTFLEGAATDTFLEGAAADTSSKGAAADTSSKGAAADPASEDAPLTPRPRCLTLCLPGLAAPLALKGAAADAASKGAAAETAAKDASADPASKGAAADPASEDVVEIPASKGTTADPASTGCYGRLPPCLPGLAAPLASKGSARDMESEAHSAKPLTESEAAKPLFSQAGEETTYQFGTGLGAPTRTWRSWCLFGMSGLCGLSPLLLLIFGLSRHFSAPVTTTTTTTSSTTVPYNCDQDFDDWAFRWSPLKKAWCCQQKDRGCSTADTVPRQPLDGSPTVAPAPENAAVASTSAVATAAAAAGAGTTANGTAAPQAPPPYNCSLGMVHWSKEWSLKKQNYCCMTENKGCSERAYICDAGVSDWQTKWSEGKKAWCCKKNGVGCPAPQDPCDANQCETHAGTDMHLICVEERKVECCMRGNATAVTIGRCCTSPEAKKVVNVCKDPCDANQCEMHAGTDMYPICVEEKEVECCLGGDTTATAISRCCERPEAKESVNVCKDFECSDAACNEQRGTPTFSACKREAEIRCCMDGSVTALVQERCCTKPGDGSLGVCKPSAEQAPAKALRGSQAPSNSNGPAGEEEGWVGECDVKQCKVHAGTDMYPICVQEKEVECCTGGNASAVAISRCCASPEAKQMVKACGALEPVVDGSGYDCAADFADWQAAWSDLQKTWCCEHFGKGCEPTPPTPQQVSFDCAAGLANWRAEWSALQKTWCCDHAGKGCASGPARAAMLPPEATAVSFDCAAGFANWRAEWSALQKTWCCHHAGKGCHIAG